MAERLVIWRGRGDGNCQLTVVGQFPPLLAGCAIANDAFAGQMASRGWVVRAFSISPLRAPSRGVDRLVRLGRSLFSGLRLGVGRRTVVVLGLDGGLGLWYSLPSLVAARLRRSPILFLHHSSRYLAAPSGVVALIVRIGGDAVHVWPCESLCDAFRRTYSETLRSASVNFAFAARPSAEPLETSEIVSEEVRIGFAGHRTRDKGFDVAISCIEKLARRHKVALHVAGTKADEELEDGLDRLASNGITVRDYGEVVNERMPSFFAELDCFIFPSRLPDETFGIVVSEALLAGVPVVGHEIGCVSADRVGPSGLVVADSGNNFLAAVESLIERIENGEGSSLRDAALKAGNTEHKCSLSDLDEISSRLMRRSESRCPT